MYLGYTGEGDWLGEGEGEGGLHVIGSNRRRGCCVEQSVACLGMDRMTVQLACLFRYLPVIVHIHYVSK